MTSEINHRREALYNARIYTGSEILTGKAILIAGDQILDIVDEGAIPNDFAKINLQQKNICPSFIDLQIYGGNGRLYSQDISVASLSATYEYSLAGGATHFMITMATNTIDRFLEGMDVASAYWAQGGKGLLGLHMEGPYLNIAKRGAHVEAYIRKPTLPEVQMLLERGAGVLKMITVAPECCDDEIIDLLLKSNMIVSAGHSNGDYIAGTRAFNMGIPTATHLFNAMSPFQSREPGMVCAVYDHPHAMASIICDGVHVDYASVRISKKIMGDRLFFITDAVTETSEGDYQHVFKGDRYTLPNGTLSGSSVTMKQCVKNAVEHAGIPLDEALRMASTYPAKLLGNNSRLGKIAPGFDASFFVFDNNLEGMVWQ